MGKVREKFVHPEQLLGDGASSDCNSIMVVHRRGRWEFQMENKGENGIRTEESVELHRLWMNCFGNTGSSELNWVFQLTVLACKRVYSFGQEISFVWL